MTHINKKQDLLIEIGTEELPYNNLDILLHMFKKNIIKELITKNINYERIKGFITPRRFSIIINGLPIKQKSKIELKKGPSTENTLNKNGTPNKSIIKFSEKYNTNINNLKKIKNKNGEWFFYEKKVLGKSIQDLIESIIKISIENLIYANPMKWGMNNKSFIRPIHWFILTLNNKVINCDLFNVKSNDFTYGHRFLYPKKIKVTAENYENKLEKIGYVIPNFEKRKYIIKNEINKISINKKMNPIINNTILTQLTGLIEYPSILLGSFDKNFLKMTDEILIAIILKYQKCIPLKNKKKLTNKFIIISNIITKNLNKIIKGYNKSINFRLSDLIHIYNEEKNTFMKKKNIQLKNIIFQEK